MGMFDHFPYTNFHELNLDWILQVLKEIEKTMDQFVAINSLKYADPIQWNIVRQYEKNTIVIDPLTGTAYISVQAVPSGVALTNEDYWTVVFDLGSFVVRAAKNFTLRWEEATTLTATIPINEGQWVVWGDTLYRALSNIIAGDQYVIDSNIKRITVEEIKDEIYQSFNAIIGDLENLNTEDKSNLVAAINEVINTVGALEDLDTTDKSNLVAAINEVINTVGALADLNTEDKSNLVAAINEVLTTLADTASNLVTSISGVDSKIGNLTALNTEDKSSVVAAINEVLTTLADTASNLVTSISGVDSKIGNLTALNTEDKSSVVAAINEVVALSGSEIFSNRKFIMIGDSYANGTNMDDPSHPLTGFYTHFVNYAHIPAGNYYITAADGYGFARPNLTFLSLLQALNVPAPAEITDIVVCGGANDNPDGIYENIESAIATFCNYCRSNYPNANVHIGMISHNYEGSNSNYRLNRVFMLYLKAALENGASYINNIENVLHFSGCFNPDGHPSVTGQELLGRSLVDGLKTGYVSIWSQNQLQNTLTLDSIWSDANITTIFTTQHDNVVEIVNNQFINISLVNDIAVNNREYSDYIKIGHLSNTHILGGDFNFTTWCAPICLYLAAGTNTGAIGEYYVSNGDLYIRVYNTLKQNYTIHGIRICPFAATFPAKYC